MALAKQAATLDWVSKGRLTIIVGSGWLRSEFDALGVGFDDRGDRTDEYLRWLKACWTEPRPSFGGTYLSVPPSSSRGACRHRTCLIVDRRQRSATRAAGR